MRAGIRRVFVRISGFGRRAPCRDGESARRAVRHGPQRGVVHRVGAFHGLLALDPHNAQTLDPSAPTSSARTHTPLAEGETYASARSRLSLNTPVTLRIMSRLSVARPMIRCAAWLATPAVGGSPGRSTTLGSGPPSGACMRVAQRCGRCRMNARTVALAGSGSAPPAYLDTTSTTSRIVCTTSCLTSLSVLSACGEMTASDCGESGPPLCAFTAAIRSRRISIRLSMRAVAYCELLKQTG